MPIKRILTFDRPCPLSATSLLIALSLLSGCSTDTPDAADSKTGSSHTHDDDHDEEAAHPETYEEAVAAVVGMDREIKDALAKDDKKTAHAPLHKIGHVLEEINELAAKTDMTDEQRKTVDGAVDQLFDAFGAIDAVMHGKDGKTYDEVAKQIEVPYV